VKKTEALTWLVILVLLAVVVVLLVAILASRCASETARVKYRPLGVAGRRNEHSRLGNRSRPRLRCGIGLVRRRRSAPARLTSHVLHDRDGALADERDRHRVGAHAVARGPGGGVGGVEEGRGESMMHGAVIR